MTKPREWWILLDEPYVFDEEPFEGSEFIHVIEKSAYDSVVESLILAKQQRDKWEMACKEAVRRMVPVDEPTWEELPFEDPQEKKYRDTGI